MVEKLKSCPFCGGNTCIIQKDNTLREDKRTCTYQIVCSVFYGGCGASGGVCLTAPKAIEAWNRRMPSVQTVQKTGRWIFEKGDGETCVDGYMCSACGRSFHTNVPYFSEYSFCPNCGAKMESEG